MEMRGLYRKTLSWAAHPRARWVLAGVSFAESSFFPIPPDILLMVMVLADRARAWSLAAICTVASVLGGVAGYALGYFLFEWIGRPLVALYGYEAQFAAFARHYGDYGVWIVLFAGLTPFPYKVVTIASGVAGLNLPVFILTSVLARGLRYFAVSGLLWWFGPPVHRLIERYAGTASAIVAVVFVTLLIGGFVAVGVLM